MQFNTKSGVDKKDFDFIIQAISLIIDLNTCLYSRYYDYTLSINGQAEQHGQDYEIDYLTDVIRRKALDWLKGYRNAKDQLDDGNVSPFLMVLAPPAPHAPSVSAPQYKNEFLIRKAPRNPSFNYVKDGNRDKHWLMRYNSEPFNETFAGMIDIWFRKRWRTLLSVDDLVDNVLKELEDIGELNNTFVLYSSDNGYHLGTFGMIGGKGSNYESGKT